MTDISELQRTQKVLQDQIDALLVSKRDSVLHEVQQAIAYFEFSSSDLGLKKTRKPKSPEARSRSKKAALARSRVRRRKVR